MRYPLHWSWCALRRSQFQGAKIVSGSEQNFSDTSEHTTRTPQPSRQSSWEQQTGHPHENLDGRMKHGQRRLAMRHDILPISPKKSYPRPRDAPNLINVEVFQISSRLSVRFFPPLGTYFALFETRNLATSYSVLRHFCFANDSQFKFHKSPC